MRFLVDQNLSLAVAEGLGAAGHDAVHTEALGLARADDEVVLQRAQAEDRVVVSADTDFGDLLVLHGSRKPSIVLIRRPRERRAKQVLALLLPNLPVVEDDLLRGRHRRAEQ
ncbi:MAG: hypothetical protein AVDCRST_MAG76-172 [uncultured Acidimicrobiales bacterium]|uniref:DUF5615 domain-containing protein n=1 Tax=uncultured Acidimicrobiales bacterium TaxID=310071 RepID=A0A6J4H3S2_9ACTN|nr:MAG: hypothetical protein AVDCRST_MAG76-172 [uncultured Acidimicrobiales bacterium]